MTKSSLILAAVVASQLGFVMPVSAQSRDLLAGTPGDLGALPSRARKSAAPEITLPLKLEAVRNESHPALRSVLIVGEEVLRLVGAGFGREAGGREVQMRVGSEQVALRILGWRDDEIRVQLPDLVTLGIDARTAATLEHELATSKKRVLGPNVEIGIALDGKWVAKRSAQLAVAYRDLDGDGSLTSEDCDDFDPRRKPSNQEVYDTSGLDEDCNDKTQAAAPVAPVMPVAPATTDAPADPLGLGASEL